MEEEGEDGAGADEDGLFGFQEGDREEQVFFCQWEGGVFAAGAEAVPGSRAR